MQMFYKMIINGYIVGVTSCASFCGVEITEAEYNDILDIIHHAPTAPDGFAYRLRADTLEWELVELPPTEDAEEEAAPEDYEAALAELGVKLDE